MCLDVGFGRCQTPVENKSDYGYVVDLRDTVDLSWRNAN